jgi:hypothetical protein
MKNLRKDIHEFFFNIALLFHAFELGAQAFNLLVLGTASANA